LHDNDTIEVELMQQLAQVVDRGGRRRERALRQVRKPSRIEGVDMTVTGVARDVRVPCTWKPSRSMCSRISLAMSVLFLKPFSAQ
jgi:hypothetical protein